MHIISFGTKPGEAGYNAFEIADLMGRSDIYTRNSCPKYALPHTRRKPTKTYNNGGPRTLNIRV
jgi:hypothetical protein